MFAAELQPLVVDTVQFLNKAIAERKKIVVEGANAAMLDIDFGGCGKGVCCMQLACDCFRAYCVAV